MDNLVEHLRCGVALQIDEMARRTASDSDLHHGLHERLNIPLNCSVKGVRGALAAVKVGKHEDLMTFDLRASNASKVTRRNTALSARVNDFVHEASLTRARVAVRDRQEC